MKTTELMDYTVEQYEKIYTESLKMANVTPKAISIKDTTVIIEYELDGKIIKEEFKGKYQVSEDINGVILPFDSSILSETFFNKDFSEDVNSEYTFAVNTKLLESIISENPYSETLIISSELVNNDKTIK